jgi:hypothetical protein
MPINSPPITRIRSIPRLAHNIPDNIPETKDIADILVKPETYREANLKQVTRDWIANQGRIYINNQPVKSIIEKMRSKNLERVVIAYFSEEIENKVGNNYRQSSLIDFSKLYSALTGTPIIPESELQNYLPKFANHYVANEDMYHNVILETENIGLKNLLCFMKQEFEGYFTSNNSQSQEILRTLLTENLLYHLPEEERQPVLRVLESYAHQGGFCYAASAGVSQVYTSINSVLDSQNNHSHDALLATTFNYTSVAKGVSVRELTPETALGHVDENSNFVIDLKMEDLANTGVELPGLIEFDITHTVEFVPEEKEAQLKLKSAQAIIFDPKAWNSIIRQLNQVLRFEEARPFLVEYAQNYLKNGHDKAQAEILLAKYPEFLAHNPVKQLGTLTALFNSTAVEHNNQDRILSVFGKIDRSLKVTLKIPETFADGIKNNFKDYTADEDKFVMAMKLLVRLDEKEMLIKLLKPFNTKGLKEKDMYTTAGFKQIYAEIKQQQPAVSPLRPK